MQALIWSNVERLFRYSSSRWLTPSIVRAALVGTFVVLAIAASACGGDDDDLSESTADPTTATATPTATTTPTAVVTAAATEPATASPTPEARLEFEFDPPGTRAWVTEQGRVNVNFYSEIRNTGDVPIEVVRIDYEISNRSGATTDLGTLTMSYPLRLAPGASGAIGTTLRGVSASDDDEINIIQQGRIWSHEILLGERS